MASKDPDIDQMPSECDFSDSAKPEIGKYAERYNKHARIVKLDEDVAKHFSDAASVNNALRSHISQSDARNAG